MKITINKWKPYQKNSLQGFFNLTINDIGLSIEGVGYFNNNEGKKWLTLPTKSYQAKDGKTKYQPFISFPEPDHYWAFCGAVWDAIEAWKAARV